jgi:two-component system chemotaxis response regulator CheB
MKKDEVNACLQIAKHFTGCNLENEFLVRAIVSNTRRRLQNLKIEKFVHYILKIADDKLEFLRFLSFSTIHTTFWFREEKHFEILEKKIKEKKIRFVRVNCLACSTGEEAYSIAFVLEDLKRKGEIDGYKIDASDIDFYSVLKAKKGKYNANGCARFIRDFSSYYQLQGQHFTINKEIKQNISFSKQNLIDLDTIENTYDFVFCRNVFIYFDFLMIKKILKSVSMRLKDSGFFFIGHCENLELGAQDNFQLDKNSVYLKKTKEKHSKGRHKRRKKNILCLDDSPSMLKILEKRLSRDFNIFIAENSKKADEILKDQKIDHLILDLNMPDITGDEYLRSLRKRNIHIPVLLLSEVTREEADRVVGSLFFENVDFLNKSMATREALFNKLNSQQITQSHFKLETDFSEINDTYVDAILIGGSTGAIPIIKHMLTHIKKPHRPIVLIEHIEESFLPIFAKTISEYLGSPLMPVEEGVELQDNHLYMAQKAHHLDIYEDNQALKIRYKIGDAVDGHKPSITSLFQSAAKTNHKFAAFLLSGMGKDGALGLKELKQQGSLTFTQNEESCVVYGMPKVAMEMEASIFSCNPKELQKLLKLFSEQRINRSIKVA